MNNQNYMKEIGPGHYINKLLDEQEDGIHQDELWFVVRKFDEKEGGRQFTMEKKLYKLKEKGEKKGYRVGIMILNPYEKIETNESGLFVKHIRPEARIIGDDIEKQQGYEITAYALLEKIVHRDFDAYRIVEKGLPFNDIQDLSEPEDSDFEELIQYYEEQE